ncbi:haloacid dehalogenase [Polychaeton citri CBS 116435]|uniref:Haloacid dehalogenase n=1 Tax=Polychaeton citri CBS 116435 TaxID=1314669 RepID=A0A9P4UKH1_9PEZI|nr:haloacid dehalogenase [Polychaeton citri CBS 116435]
MTKSACFDVIGTCFGFSTVIDAIASRLGTKLAVINVDPKTLFFSWFYAAQRDFTYVSIAGDYSPIAQVLRSTFKRACLIVDLPASEVAEEDVAAIMEAFAKMPAREGLKSCFDGLNDIGWEVFAVTNGGVQTSLNYYQSAGIELDKGHLMSCDDIQVAKPDVRVYENANQRLKSQGLHSERWFIAAHAWDLIAARKAGFKTAYLEYEEHDPVPQIFGRFDIIAGSMEDLLKQLQAL